MISRYLNSTEDSLTATVLSQLLHLPIETFWAVLRDACIDPVLPVTCGEPDEVAFWPNWSAENTDNSYRVEPDIFMRFAEFDLIIEAKRWDSGGQNSYQWKNEIQAYANDYGEEEKPVYLLALGGLHGFETESCEVPEPHGGHCPVVKSMWIRLLQAVIRQRDALQHLPFPDSTGKAHLRILENVIDAFAHHNFYTGKWYADMPFYQHRLSRQTHMLSFQ